MNDSLFLFAMGGAVGFAAGLLYARVMRGLEALERFVEGLSDELVRVEQLRERARGLSALLAERRRGLERDQGQMMADDVVATLEADVSGSRAELTEVERGLGIAGEEAARLAAEEATFEREREENGMFASVPSSQASSAAAEVRGELRTLRNTVEQNAGEITRLQARIEQINQRDLQAH